MISRRIEAAQKAVETQNFESRKHVLEYDDVMNKQREAVYGLRRQLMEGVDQKQLITEDYVSTILSNILDENAPEKAHADEWKLDTALLPALRHLRRPPRRTEDRRHTASTATSSARPSSKSSAPATTSRSRSSARPAMRYHERIVMLSVLDGLWKDHLLAMDHLKEGIGLRGYAQQDPLVAYKKESFEMFEAMMLRFQEDTARHLFRMQIIGPDGKPIETAEQLHAAQQATSAYAAGSAQHAAAARSTCRCRKRQPRPQPYHRRRSCPSATSAHDAPPRSPPPPSTRSSGVSA